MVLKPGRNKKELKVFCVESGRWSSRNTGSRNNNTASFNGHFNKGSMGLRKVVEKEKDQSKVWSKVDQISNANKTNTSTKTYTALTASGDYNKKLNAYLNFFRNKFITDKNVIGVIVVTGNRVLGCDMFATHALFESQYESLLHSYVTEAVIDGKAVNISPAVVKNYMDQLLSSEKIQEQTIKSKGNVFVDNGKKLRVSGFDE
jgi:hypothetical protein